MAYMPTTKGLLQDLFANILKEKANVNKALAKSLAIRIIDVFESFGENNDGVSVYGNSIEFVEALTGYADRTDGVEVDYELLYALSKEELHDAIAKMGEFIGKRPITTITVSDPSKRELLDFIVDMVLKKSAYRNGKNQLEPIFWKHDGGCSLLFINGVTCGRLSVEDGGFYFRASIGRGSYDNFFKCDRQKAMQEAEMWLAGKYREHISSLRKSSETLQSRVGLLYAHAIDNLESGNLPNYLDGDYFLITTYSELNLMEQKELEDKGDEQPLETLAVELEFLKKFAAEECGYASFEDFLSNYTYDEVFGIASAAEREKKLAFTICHDGETLLLPYNFDKELHFTPYMDYIRSIAKPPFTTFEADKATSDVDESGDISVTASIDLNQPWIRYEEGNGGEENYYRDYLSKTGKTLYCDGECLHLYPWRRPEKHFDEVLLRNYNIEGEDGSDYCDFIIPKSQFEADFSKMSVLGIARAATYGKCNLLVKSPDYPDAFEVLTIQEESDGPSGAVFDVSVHLTNTSSWHAVDFSATKGMNITGEDVKAHSPFFKASEDMVNIIFTSDYTDGASSLYAHAMFNIEKLMTVLDKFETAIIGD